MHNFRFLLVILLSTFIVSGVFAQSAAEGENLFNNRQYAKAKAVYAALLKRNSKDALNNYRYARCCYELKEYETAITHFELSGTRYPLTTMYLGELYFHTYRFAESVAAYQTYIQSLEAEDPKIQEFEGKIKTSELGERLLNRVEDIAIIDSIVVNKNEFLRFYKQSRETGSVTQERIRLINKQIQDKIIYKTERGDRSYFSDSIKGNMDIFTSFKLLDEWSKPLPISKNINTKANENYPFLLLDGLTLFFASDGEGSLGGYDIFYTRYSPPAKDYLNPENVGFPFNSPWNDYMMIMDDLQKVGWFASDRYQPAGKIVIYKFELNNPKKYFRSEDAEQTRLVARLLKTRKADKSKFKNVIETVSPEKEVAKEEFVVVINDSTVYHQLDQFQSMKALEIFKSCISLKDEQNNLQNELDKLRSDYATIENQEEMSKLAEMIKAKEKLWLSNEALIKNKFIEASNEEIKFIDKN
ncbi:MAG: tetratricopeptide repeat protein [Bacteroidia bacterium]|nr:tetratricopeptide repeat protein [Bacteroidia bacterium]